VGEDGFYRSGRGVGGDGRCLMAVIMPAIREGFNGEVTNQGE
jgi:hypothetical protein